MTPEEKKIYDKEYYKNNRERRLKQSRKWLENHKEDRAAKTKIYLQKASVKQRRKEYAKQYKQQYVATVEGRYVIAKSHAKCNDKDFTLTLEQYRNIIKNPCYYCNNSLSYLGQGNGNKGCGLDRLDNNKGYHLDNVVSCCGGCNSIRGDRLTSEETKIAITAIINYRSMELI